MLFEVMAAALVPGTFIAYAIGRRHEQIISARRERP
jgi:hypothetical protein